MKAEKRAWQEADLTELDSELSQSYSTVANKIQVAARVAERALDLSEWANGNILDFSEATVTERMGQWRA